MRHEELQGGRNGVLKVRSWSETWKDSCCCRHRAKELGGKDGTCCPLIVQKGPMQCEAERKRENDKKKIK